MAGTRDLGSVVGPQGPKGDKGDVGATGTQGAQGPAGKDATINGENTVTIQPGENVTITQAGNVLTISAAGDATMDQVNAAIRVAVLDSWERSY